MTQFADPDVSAAEDSGEFLTNEELIGRHLIIVPKTIENVKGEGNWADGSPKQDRDMVKADIIILDGRKNPKIASFPHIERGKNLYASKIVAELRKYVGTGQPVLGYFTQVNKGYFLEPADSDAQKLAQPAWEKYEGQASEPPF